MSAEPLVVIDIPTRTTRLDLALLLSQPDEPIEWVWTNYIERGTVVCAHGAPGRYKSLIAGGLARCVTTGGVFLGQPVAQGRVLIIDAENPPQEIRRRLRPLGFTPENIEALTYERANGPIYNGETFEPWLAEVIRETGATLVVLDSQRGIAAVDEKEQLEMRLFYSVLRRVAEATGAAILVLHHDNRNLDYSGSGDIDACVDGRLHLHRPADSDNKRRVFLTHAKLRQLTEDGPQPTLQVEVVIEHGVAYFTVVGTGEPAKSRPVTDNLRAQVVALVSTGEVLERAAVARKLGRDPKDATIRSIFSELIREGVIEQVGTNPVTVVSAGPQGWGGVLKDTHHNTPNGPRVQHPGVTPQHTPSMYGNGAPS
jgi:KaiC/GvpD/RAD55 family RecA-like ATPase